MQPIINVQYKSKYDDSFTGREYSYMCPIPVNVGDIVKAPTARGESIARVSRTDVPVASVNPYALSNLRVITEKILQREAECFVSQKEE